ncbi:sialidase family protein [Pseudoalteromonas sp.]|uniref:WD40/YVTN/BNR-like repeat-containing protein n=1 Tax=Pseudoalteromonas sp. TaxID=53249 RepID=UPI0023557D15|nr:sialidase family protein [Pseudoalteromonas sp.]
MDSIVDNSSTLRIGDVVLTYNKKTSAGNELLEMSGSVLDKTKYPLLAVVLGSKEQLVEAIPITSTTATGVDQSDDGEHCYLALGASLYKYTRSLNSYALINSGIGAASGEIVCSADGRYVVYCSGVTSSQVANCKAYIFISSDYGQTFTLTKTMALTTYTPGFSFATLFMSRNGQNVVVLANDAHGGIINVSKNYGASWTTTVKSDGIKGQFQSTSICATEDISKIWTKKYSTINDTSKIIESTDSGAVWSDSDDLGGGISEVRIDPYNNNNMIAYRYNSISAFKISRDGGVTWESLSMPSAITRLRIATIDRGAIYIYGEVTSTDYRFYTSTDGGVEWAENELPVNIGQFAFKPKRVDGSPLYFVQNNTLHEAMYSSLCKLPKANLLSERIIADKVVV